MIDLIVWQLAKWEFTYERLLLCAPFSAGQPFRGELGRTPGWESLRYGQQARPGQCEEEPTGDHQGWADKTRSARAEAAHRRRLLNRETRFELARVGRRRRRHHQPADPGLHRAAHNP